jgi:hypothetical protein
MVLGGFGRMFEIKVDISRNCLYVKVDGTPELEESRKAAKTVLDRAGRLRRGFTVISDLSRAYATPDVADELRAIQLILAIMGAKKGIRIIPSESRLQGTAGDWAAGYEVVEVGSFEDAVALVNPVREARQETEGSTPLQETDIQ